MSQDDPLLMTIFHGWDGYQISLVRAVAPLSPEQSAFRLTPETRSVGEIAAHIALGRIDWFSRMGAPGSVELAERVAPLWQGKGRPEAAIAGSAGEILPWLEASWKMVEDNLGRWTTADLAWTYPQPYQGKTYAVSRQWVIWRILAHDIHHGGQLTMALAAQGIYPPDLSGQGGHIIEPPVA